MSFPGRPQARRHLRHRGQLPQGRRVDRPNRARFRAVPSV